jgi:hypothetical protein
MQFKKQHYALAYGILLPLLVYIYCMPKNTHTQALAQQQAKVFGAFGAELKTKIAVSKPELEEAIRQNPKYTEWLEKYSKLSEICKIARHDIDKIAKKQSFLGFRQTQTAAALDRIKVLNQDFLDFLDQKYWKDSKDWEERVGSHTDFQAIKDNPSLFFLALQNHIDFLENAYLGYCMDKASGVINCFVPSFPYLSLDVQTESTCLREGDRLKGCLAAVSAYYHIDKNLRNLRINGKPYPTVKGIALYKHPPQPAGKYPLVASCEVVVGDTTITVRDTLYYTVR